MNKKVRFSPSALLERSLAIRKEEQMKLYAGSSLLLLALSLPQHALAKFEAMKPGEWKAEIIESSFGAAGKLAAPRVECISEEESKRDWEAFVKDEFKKSAMDCQLTKLKEDSSNISYKVQCEGTDNSQGKKDALPKGSKFLGTVDVKRESDTSYLMDSDSKLTGYKLPESEMAKIPAEQRQMVAAALAMKSGDIHLKVKQRYSYIGAKCTKADSSVKASVEKIKSVKPEKK